VYGPESLSEKIMNKRNQLGIPGGTHNEIYFPTTIVDGACGSVVG
jgi:hypothetical protein